MPTLSAILADLRAEIESEIRAINVNRFIDRKYERFELFSPGTTGENIFTQQRPRLFSIGACAFTDPDCIGHTKDSSVEEIPITFVYPRSEKWADAAADDLNKIRHYFSTTPSSADGVCQRIIEYEKPTVVEHTDDPWNYYTVIMMAWLEVDHS